jgi:hypothetical protein
VFFVLFLSFFLHANTVNAGGRADCLSAITKSTSVWGPSLRRCKDQVAFFNQSLFIKMQKGIRFNDGHVTYLGLLAKKDGTRRGCLSKKSSDNTKWHTKWFALLQNMLFYFESESSSRPAGLYLLEGCVCDRAPSPKPSQSSKECLEKQVGITHIQVHNIVSFVFWGGNDCN